jgi:conjugal transfer/type IV secretion protein DotA/TraY
MALFDTKKDKKELHNIGAGDVVKYMTLPRILPRIAAFISTGFKTLAFFIACVLSTVRLIPAGHPFMQSKNIGQFGIIQVLALAANNIEFRKDKADQVIVFTVIIAAIAILALQVFTLLASFVMMPAMAQIANIFAPYPAFVPGGAGTVGAAADGRFDIAMILLDRVFGVPNFFNSCVSMNVPCTGINASGLNSATEVHTSGGTLPWPFHRGLQQMYLFYSLALLVVGLFIFIYFIMVIIIETAQTGTPFGRRFNSVWAPIRMVVAVGLLIPFAFGMNSAQYITLYAAKWGSGLATTAWFNFASTLSKLSTEQELLGTPTAQTANQLISFMSLAMACKYHEETYFKYDPAITGTVKSVQGWLVKNNSNAAQRRQLFNAVDYNGARTFYENGNVVIRFGDMDPALSTAAPVPKPAYNNETGQVRNACGQLVMTTTDMASAGPQYLYQGYYALLRNLWEPGAPAPFPPATGATGAQNCSAITNLGDIQNTLSTSSQAWMAARIKQNGTAAVGAGGANYFNAGETKENVHAAVKEVIQCLINNAVRVERASGAFDIPPDLLVRGWAGAGIWYNKIAAMNGTLISAANNIPAATAYPIAMERTAKAKLRVDKNVSAGEIYNPKRSDGKMLNLPRGDAEVAAAQAYYDLYKYWLTDSNRIGKASTSGNFFGEMLSGLFGLDGLYSITSNSGVHPLAKLVGVGKGLIDSTIRNLTVGTVAMGGSVIATYIDNPALSRIGEEGGAIIGDVMFSVATIGLTAGFVLYYVIPFLPFIYFFFAVGNWIKTVFEAMVGVPLWALAHIRIDGNGLPGDAAINGYYLIFEIFLRPIMIIFGLIAGITVFAAMAAVLHDIWDIVLANVGGSGDAEKAGLIESIRGPVDKLFYLVVYTIILYMMAVSSFKLVELIPQQILRWMGANVSSFVDQSQDAAGGLVQYAAIGGGHMFGQITGGTKDAMSKGMGALKK